MYIVYMRLRQLAYPLSGVTLLALDSCADSTVY